MKIIFKYLRFFTQNGIDYFWPMQKLIYVIIPFLYLTGCGSQEQGNQKLVDEVRKSKRDPFHQLCQYWEVTDAENPTFRDIFDNQKDGVVNYPGIVFMTDSTFLENPRGIPRYGKFSYHGKMLEARFDDGKQAKYLIQLKEPNAMTVLRVEKEQSTVLHMEPSEVFYENGENPYAKENTTWMFPPSQIETDDQLKDRLKNCVVFYKYFLKGHADSKAEEIDFTALPSCFRWYQGGIFVQNSKSLDRKWINCFYSKDQALHARDMMQDVLLKKYDWDTTQRNWIAQLVPVLEQIQKQF